MTKLQSYPLPPLYMPSQKLVWDLAHFQTNSKQPHSISKEENDRILFPFHASIYSHTKHSNFLHHKWHLHGQDLFLFFFWTHICFNSTRKTQTTENNLLNINMYMYLYKGLPTHTPSAHGPGKQLTGTIICQIYITSSMVVNCMPVLCNTSEGNS